MEFDLNYLQHITSQLKFLIRIKTSLNCILASEKLQTWLMKKTDDTSWSEKENGTSHV
jgi:hypothetical protein